MHVRTFRSALVAVLSAVLAACAAEQAVRRLPVSPPPAATPPEVWDLVFPDPLRIPPEVTVDKASDPEALVLFALRLAERGDVQRAADFFLEAAALPRAASLRNAFRIATLAAAASCLLQAGDLARFQKVVERLREAMDRYQVATLRPELAVLLAIAAKARGDRVALPPDVPVAIRHLLQNQ